MTDKMAAPQKDTQKLDPTYPTNRDLSVDELDGVVGGAGNYDSIPGRSSVGPIKKKKP